MLEEREKESRRLGQVDLQFGQVVETDPEDHDVGLVLSRDALVGEALLTGRPAGESQVEDIDVAPGRAKRALEKLRERLGRFEPVAEGHAVAQDHDPTQALTGLDRAGHVAQTVDVRLLVRRIALALLERVELGVLEAFAPVPQVFLLLDGRRLEESGRALDQAAEDQGGRGGEREVSKRSRGARRVQAL